jgi:glycosyltransferase involved in cell wall biosynthesis
MPIARVLIVRWSVLSRLDECGEVWEHMTGMVAANTDSGVEILVCDGRTVYRPSIDANHQMNLERQGSLAATWQHGTDVVYIPGVLPVVRHVLLAALFRLRGARIVFAPMVFLTEEFARRSWTHPRPRWWTAAKPVARRILIRVWKILAHAFVCQSRHEAVATSLDEARCVFLPWPAPNVPLLTSCGHLDAGPSRHPDAPVAFVSRMDPWRKGMDRMCEWLTAYASTLPHPAVVLLAPRATNAPPQLHNLVRAGLIEWDWDSRGADLRGPLRRCRGAMLLSRFDGQPRSLREALSLGLPIVCTPECGLDEIVAVLDAGTIIDADSPADVQAAFESLLETSVDSAAVHRLFDRVEVGRFLLAALVAVGAGRQPPHSYYTHYVTRSTGSLSPGRQGHRRMPVLHAR